MTGSPPDSDNGRSDPIARLRSRLLGLAMKMIWNRCDAEELVQEAMLLALKKAMPLNEPAGQAWAWRTVSHLCLNHRRRRRVEPLDDWLAVDSSKPPEHRAERTEHLVILRELIETLPSQQRLALTLRDMERMEYADIAGIMKVTESAVRTHVRLARRRLAESMTGRGEGIVT